LEQRPPPPMLAQHAYGCTSLAAACDETEARCDLRFSLSQLDTLRHSRGRNATSSAERSPLQRRRAQGMPEAGRPHGPPAKRKAGGSHHTRFSRITRHSLHDGFNAHIALSLGTGLSCPHRLVHHHAKSLASASGGQDHTILRRHRSSARTGRARRHSVHRSGSVRFGHNAPHKLRRTRAPCCRFRETVKPIFENQN
jgi:hypothetical protein